MTTPLASAYYSAIDSENLVFMSRSDNKLPNKDILPRNKSIRISLLFRSKLKLFSPVCNNYVLEDRYNACRADINHWYHIEQ